MVCTSEESYEDILCSHMSINDTRNDDGGDSDAPCDFLDHRTSRIQSRRGDEGTRITINNDSKDEIQNSFTNLDKEESFWPFGRVFELIDEAEKTTMPG